MYGALEEGEGSTPVATQSEYGAAEALHAQAPPHRDLTAAIEAAPQPHQSFDPKGRM